nr:hypothetical protein GCM10020093_005450 [Planobispora longispora]
MVRFHGHSEKWTSKKIEERFAYLYSEAELEHWAGRLRAFSREAETVHVLMNNCCRDNAQRNAARMAELLGDLAAEETGPNDRPRPAASR